MHKDAALPTSLAAETNHPSLIDSAPPPLDHQSNLQFHFCKNHI